MLAHNFTTGEWVERQVAERHENVYRGPLVTLATDAGEIRTTVYHPFWVVRGDDLGERSQPRELSEREDEGLSLDGRWVNSHELRVGDVLVARDGTQRTLLGVAQKYVSGFPVNNLTIDENHTFAVGPDAILVHNTSGCPGSASPQETARRLGREGEDAAGIAKNNSPIPSQTGTKKYRVPDEIQPNYVKEVKNVAELSFGSQIQDSLYFAITEGKEFILVVRHNTVLSKPLQLAINARWITLEFLP